MRACHSLHSVGAAQLAWTLDALKDTSLGVCVCWLQALLDSQQAKDAAALKVAEDNLANSNKVQCSVGSILGVGSIRPTAPGLPTDSGPLTGWLVPSGAASKPQWYWIRSTPRAFIATSSRLGKQSQV
jgi:hypothetical protein